VRGQALYDSGEGMDGPHLTTLAHQKRTQPCFAVVEVSPVSERWLCPTQCQCPRYKGKTAAQVPSLWPFPSCEANEERAHGLAEALQSLETALCLSRRGRALQRG